MRRCVDARPKFRARRDLNKPGITLYIGWLLRQAAEGLFIVGAAWMSYYKEYTHAEVKLRHQGRVQIAERIRLSAQKDVKTKAVVQNSGARR